jgi:ribosomal protein S27E
MHLKSTEYANIAVACIYCRKTTFRFSRNALYSYGYSNGKIELKCPRCNKTTIYNGSGIIEAG